MRVAAFRLVESLPARFPGDPSPPSEPRATRAFADFAEARFTTLESISFSTKEHLVDVKGISASSSSRE
jgi:hypothetical protein